MIRLTAPDPARFESWAACLRDFEDGPIDGSGYVTDSTPEPAPEEFARYIEQRLAEGNTSTPPAPERVHCSYRWIVDETWADGGPLLGFLALRHHLNRFLLTQGGHIGYSVRPSARRRGVAGAALAVGLSEAAGLGIDPVLVCCAETNEASRRTIERNGGQYESSIGEHRRYWFGPGPWPQEPDAQGAPGR
ncbi:GNAT family N-acetyltransferase [Brachybacterium kimchii]|uniref:GNAT family N-acetyltransferase n=1 Tax=Brachybacterium kimchii TaxID=2942909 RepID=A0ABY4N4E1_9MICO|nr:GNAT family N-acetyltransferase [Brachybacterium kimchii]UQN29433.1 GNAT family N-acetyltransferase [Brachybacterium kimchii]